MKRIALFFALAVAAVSCAPEVTVTPEIEVFTGEEQLVVTHVEEMLPIAFKTNTDWTAAIKEVEAREWCAVSPGKGKAGDNTLNVICIENKGTDNRTATVVISAMDLTKELVVTQLQKDVLVLTAETEYDIPYQGEVLSFNVTHNKDLKVKSDVDWITQVDTKALIESKVDLQVAPNTGKERTGSVTFTAGPFEETITVRQDAWVLEFSVTPEEDKAFDAAGEEHKVTVVSNVEYSVKVESNDWLTMTQDGDEYVFKAVPNTTLSARETTVSISPKSAKYISAARVIKMSQKGAGAKLDISSPEVRVTCLAQTFDLSVDANIAYDMACKKVVDGAYVDIDAADRWLTYTKSGDTYTFTVPENPLWTERSAVLVFTPKDAAYSDMITVVNVYQYGHAFKMWSTRVTSMTGYDAAKKPRLARYGDKILLSNTDKVYLVDPQTGKVESTINMPAGVYAHSLVVDDAGNLMLAADAIFEKDRDDIEFVLYHIPDPMNPAPEKVFAYNIGNFYGLETGNVRVKGDIKKNAVITAVVSDGADGEGLTDGAILIWEVKNGVCGNWSWTNVPYTAWSVKSLCAYPLGASLTDGMLYVGYGGDYNLYYTPSPVLDPVLNEDKTAFVNSTKWGISYVTGSSWMENYNCIHTAEWRGTEYAAVMMGCHFNYDNSDMLLLNINDPAAAELVYKHDGEMDVERGGDWENLWWTDAGAYGDIILIPTDEALLMVGVDSNYGTFTCIAIM